MTLPKNQKLSLPLAAIIVLVVATLGIALTLFSHALGTSTISGNVWQDTNRNGVMDAGEAPMANQGIDLMDSTGQTLVGYTASDASGHYSFSGLADGAYLVKYDPGAWWAIYDNWVPDTTGSLLPQKTISLVGSATLNFGWRQIVHSTDLNAPINSYTGPNGLTVKSYNDAVPAMDVYNDIMQGSLITKETPLTTVLFGYDAYGRDVESIGGGPGNYSNYTSTIYMPYTSWLTGGDQILFHEYGHSWSLYYAYIVQQDPNLTAYLQARGIAGDPRLGTSHAWSPRELIAEDYRQLFGTPNAQALPQENTDLPPASQVPGLKEYLMGAFMTSPSDTIPPTVPTGLTGKAVSQNEIDLSWPFAPTPASTDNVGVTKYNVYRNGSLVGFMNSPSPAATFTFADSNLTANTSYQYYIKALDAAGNSSTASSTITVTTLAPDTTPPNSPTSLTVTGTTSSSLSLKWTASTDNVGVVGYKVYWLNSSRKSTYATLVGSPTATSFTVPGLSSNTSYTYYVQAIDAAGNLSAPSKTVSGRTGH